MNAKPIIKSIKLYLKKGGDNIYCGSYECMIIYLLPI